MTIKVLIIDDGDDITGYCKQFISDGFEYSHIRNGANLKKILKDEWDLILLDKNFSKCEASELLGPMEDAENEGLRILKKIKEINSSLPVIMVTACADYNSAALALRMRAYDYVEWDAMQKDFLFLKLKMLRALDWVKKSKNDLIEKYNMWGIIGKSEPMIKLFQEIESVLDTDSNILLTGDTGVGKDLVARTIHFHSKRKENPFIPVNCPAIPKNLLEAELFGVKKRAVTEVDQRDGKFLLANLGTIFLNEIGELPLDMQVKLLKTAEEKKIEPIGSSEPIDVDVRIISATNRNMEDLKEKGLFREDLYYRLTGRKIEVPSLRDRKDDLPLLIDYIIKEKSHELKKEIVGITQEAKGYLEKRDWVGNVRELENTIQRAIEKADRLVTLSDLVEEEVSVGKVTSGKGIPCSKETPIEECPIFGESNIDEIQKIAIVSALKAASGYVEPACQRLGISKANMYNKINLYKLSHLVKGYSKK